MIDHAKHDLVCVNLASGYCPLPSRPQRKGGLRGALTTPTDPDRLHQKPFVNLSNKTLPTRGMDRKLKFAGAPRRPGNLASPSMTSVRAQRDALLLPCRRRRSCRGLVRAEGRTVTTYCARACVRDSLYGRNVGCTRRSPGLRGSLLSSSSLPRSKSSLESRSCA